MDNTDTFDSFFPSNETLAHGASILRKIRDQRKAAEIFYPLLNKFRLPSHTLVDTAYYRYIVPQRKPYINLISPEPSIDIENSYDPEQTVVGGESPFANFHRDLDFVSTHFQFNLWFPFHNLEKKNSLILFPDKYYKHVNFYNIDPKARVDHKLSNPKNWGLGNPFQIEVKFGEILIFDGNHLHSGPVNVADKFRLTAELRLACGVPDDHGVNYRKLFINLKNFKPIKNASLNKLPIKNCNNFNNNVEAYNSLSQDLNFLRRSLNLKESDYVLSKVSEDSYSKIDKISKFILQSNENYLSSDLLISLARLSIKCSKYLLATKLLKKSIECSESYFWSLETGRYLLRQVKINFIWVNFLKIKVLYFK